MRLPGGRSQRGVLVSYACEQGGGERERQQ